MEVIPDYNSFLIRREHWISVLRSLVSDGSRRIVHVEEIYSGYRKEFFISCTYYGPRYENIYLM